MTEHIDFEIRLGSRLRARAAGAARPFDAAVIAQHVLAPTRHPRSMASGWSSLPRNLRWSAVALAIAGSLLAVLAIGAPLIQQSVRPRIVANGWVMFTIESNELNEPSDIYVVRPGAPERALIGFVRDGVREACPQFSPDGMRIAYLSGPIVQSIQGRDEIRILTVSADGFAVGTPRALAGGLDAEGCPEWSPDSKSVAAKKDGTLSVLGLDGRSTALDLGTSAGGPGSFDWSPEGTEIAFVGDSSIWIAPIDGSAPRRVYETDDDVELGGLEWSPDGKRIVVTAGRFSIIEALPARVIHVGGAGAPVELPGFRHITWSPDGQRLAAVRSTKHGPFEWNEIVTMSPEGSDLLVIADEQWRIQGLTWSPDGSELVYIEDQGPSPGLLLVAASGVDEPRLLLPKPRWLPNTGSDDLSWQAVFSR